MSKLCSISKVKTRKTGAISPKSAAYPGMMNFAVSKKHQQIRELQREIQRKQLRMLAKLTNQLIIEDPLEIQMQELYLFDDVVNVYLPREDESFIGDMFS